MKVKNFLSCLVISVLPITGFAEEPVKASELPKPPSEAPSKAAQKRAHQRVEKRKKELQKKLEQGASTHEISKAKAQLQVDRTESNRQDHLNDAKDSPVNLPE